MERNLGFFESWRAKLKENKNEEMAVEKVAAPSRPENGMFSRFLKMGIHEASAAGNDISSKPKDVDIGEGSQAGIDVNEKNQKSGSEVPCPVNGAKASDSKLGSSEITSLSPSESFVREVMKELMGTNITKELTTSENSTTSISTSSNTQTAEILNENAGKTTALAQKTKKISSENISTSLLSDGEVIPSTQPSKTSAPKGRRISDVKTPADSRRSSYSISGFDSNSRRGSVILSPLSSFSNIHEKIQALCQDQSQSEATPKKALKVNKLNENAFRIVKTSSTTSKVKESVKVSSKIDPSLQSKLMKFGVPSGGSKLIKKLNEDKNECKVNKTDINVTKSAAEDLKSDCETVEVIKLSDVDTELKSAKGNENAAELGNKSSEPTSGKGGCSTDEKKQGNMKLLENKKSNPEIESKKEVRSFIKKDEFVKEVKVDQKIIKVDFVVGKKLTDTKVEEEESKSVAGDIKIKKATPKKSEKGKDEVVKDTTKVQKSPSKEGSKLSSKSCEGNIESDDKVVDKNKRANTEPESRGVLPKKLSGEEAKVKEKKLETKFTQPKSLVVKDPNLKIPSSQILQRELVKEAMKVRESMTLLTNQANELVEEKENAKIKAFLEKLDKNSKNVSESVKEDKSETSNDISYKSQDDSESLSWRKEKKKEKLMKKLKVRSNPDECYPKTQKLLTSKPINAFEQAKLEQSKNESVVSPAKVEAFLRENLNPPVVCGTHEPVKTIEAVVEEIVTSKSEKSKFEKPVPKSSQVKYSSRGEVILGVVSIKPSNKVDSYDAPDTLSAITLVPAFRPEKSIFEKEEEKKARELDNFSGKNEERGRETETTSLENDGLGEVPEKCSSNRERSPFSPVSDFSDDSYEHYIPSVDFSLNTPSCDLYSRHRSVRSSSTPRRIFPQVARPSSYRLDGRKKEESPVVFDASLSFDLSSNRSSVRHHFKPQPAFTDRETSSNSLSMRIADFLNRTDHVMEEWKHLGKGGGDDLRSLVELPSRKILGQQQSSNRKSATNIMIKGLLNYSKGCSRPSSMRSRSTAKTSENSDRTISDIDELSEMTMDLSEERATGTMQAERLEAETAERVRLEQELSQIQNEKKNLQQASERLEMELFYARADVNGLSESEGDLEDVGGDAALYKNKCERAMRELEFTRRRLQQQHEDDLEQLVGLKKQLEKKLTDAYEEVEEQRQVAGQWKRKVQKLQSETNDLRLLLEEQSSRNNLLEKKQRKFDSEIQMLQEELRSEKNQKERLSREKEMAVAEKYSMEQNLSSVRLELELKEEKVAALSRELEELSRGGGTEQEVTQLRKSKHDLEMKLKEQEEELDELAGQVSMLEGNKLRLEMSLESLRKEHRREMAQRDDELDEARSNAHKKVKVLEAQLENEHEERTLLVREKHELERRLADAEERGRHYRAADEDALQRARRDLKKTKALLRDAHVMLERAKQDSPSKAALRALKNQLEDAELARASAVKARQSLESELNEINGQLEEALRAKGDAENRCQAALRETNALRTQVDENEEELAELLKKYRQTVQQLSVEQLSNQETAGALAEAEAERASLRDQLAELTAKLEANTVVDPISGLAQKKLEIRIKELESRLELEQTTRGRLEVQIARLKENVERLNEECVQARTKEQGATDLTRKLQRSLREAKEELALQQAKEQEAGHKRKELEKRLETAEQEASTARTDLRLAVKRIEDLQSAISGEIGSDSERSETDEEDSCDDSLISHVPSTISSASRTSRTPDLAQR